LHWRRSPRCGMQWKVHFKQNKSTIVMFIKDFPNIYELIGLLFKVDHVIVAEGQQNRWFITRHLVGSVLLISLTSSLCVWVCVVFFFWFFLLFLCYFYHPYERNVEIADVCEMSILDCVVRLSPAFMFCKMFCESWFVFLSFFISDIVLSTILWLTASDYTFGRFSKNVDIKLSAHNKFLE